MLARIEQEKEAARVVGLARRYGELVRERGVTRGAEPATSCATFEQWLREARTPASHKARESHKIVALPGVNVATESPCALKCLIRTRPLTLSKWAQGKCSPCPVAMGSGVS